MRVTNSMTTNTLLLNVNRNMLSLSKLQYQASTGNKIQYASDNPIIASRALKFRTMVSETEQYAENVGQGKSWLNATESALMNINEIVKTMEELTVQAANSTLTVDDRQKITNSILEFSKQLDAELNAQYSGRYLFSGFRTDEPVVFLKDQSDKKFDITESFTKLDIYNSVKLQGDSSDITKIVEKKEVIKIQMGYSDITADSLTFSDLPSGYTIVTKSLDDSDVYEPADLTLNFIEETGELILPKNFYNDLANDSFSVTYTKEGFKEGDLNPVNYFKCKEYLLDGSVKNYSMDNQAFKLEFGSNTSMQINTLGKDVLTASLKNDLIDVVNFVSSITSTNEKDLREILKQQGLSDSEIDEQVKKHLQEESKVFQSAIYDKFNSLLGRMEEHASKVSDEHTTLGVRLNRLEFISERLESDKVNFKELRDNNELADVAEVLINYNAMLAVYQSSLSIGAGIIQKSLVDFIR